MSRADGIDELDRDQWFPTEPGTPSPLFWQALRGFWSHSSAFAMAESERAGMQAARHQETFTPAAAPVPVPYPALEEDTLAHEFTDADRARLELTFDGSG